ncbi:hypothetical protein KC19_VG096100, partial [Ceratodon purpureus]
RGKAYWNGAVLNAETSRWRGRTAILTSPAVHQATHSAGIIIPGRAQWILCKLDNSMQGFLNLYARNSGLERATFWDTVAQNLPNADSWVMGGDLNMVEHEADRSGNPPKKLPREEQDGWDNLILKLGLEDTWESDGYTHHDSLRFSWTNKQQELSHLMARLDRFYVGEWGRNRGGKLEILAGFNTLSDHVPVHLHIRRKSHRQQDSRSFCFNTSFLENEALVIKLAAAWSEEPRPIGESETWALWVVKAQLRIKDFCQ